MLDEFLIASYGKTKKEQEKRAFIEDLKKLPREELKSIAFGEKVAWLNGPVAKEANGDHSWLEKFKGTPLFEQAVSLEQQELQIDAQRIQEDMQRRSNQDLWLLRDQVCLQKRLLELQLAQSQELSVTAGAGVPLPEKPPVPEAGTQGAGGLGAEALDNTDAVHNRPVGSPGLKLAAMKMRLKAAMDPALFQKLQDAAKSTKRTSFKFKPGSLPKARDLNAEARGLSAMADPFKEQKAAMVQSMAEKLAAADIEKVAISIPTGFGAGVGAAAQRILGKLGPNASKALLGAGIGAAGGVLSARDREGFHPGQAITRGLGGAALGGLGGLAAGNISMAGRGVPPGQGIARGLAMTGRQLGRAGRAAVQEGGQLMGQLSPKAPAA